MKTGYIDISTIRRYLIHTEKGDITEDVQLIFSTPMCMVVSDRNPSNFIKIYPKFSDSV